MADPEFNSKVLQLLGDRSLIALRAQTQAERYLQQVINTLADYFGYWPVFVPRAVIKSRPRLIEKIQESKSKEPALAPENAVETIKDLAAGRILVNGLEDIGIAQRFVKDYADRTSNIKIIGIRDFVHTRRESGFRGLYLDLTIKFSLSPNFPVELQIMTFLQHAWDQLQHRIYEMTRVGGVVPPALMERFVALSDRLYEADKEIDDLRF